MRKFGKFETTPETDKNKKAKNSVLLQTYFTSLISLVLCVSMFFGTSYAWFTSEVNNVGNEIYIGVLDADLRLKQVEVKSNIKNVSWVSLKKTDAPRIFTDAVKWEPGYTALETLQVVNQGDLTFDYELKFIGGEENMNMDLASLFEVYVTKNENAEPKNIAEIKAENSGWTRVGDLDKIISQGISVFEGAMITVGEVESTETAETTESSENSEVAEAAESEPAEATKKWNEEGTDTYIIALHMKEEATGNVGDQSIMGKSIKLNVKLIAYQRSGENSEEDGFGNGSYDNVTAVTTAADLADAIQAGGHILLCNDIVLNGRLDIPEGVDVYLDMNGKEIQVTEESYVDYVFIVRESSTLTIGGDGTVETATPNTTLFYPLGNLVIEDGTFVRNVPEGYTGEFWSMFVGTKPNGGWESTGVEIYGGYFDSGYYDKNAAEIEELLVGTKTLEETDDDVAKRGASGDKNVVRVALKNNTTKLLNRSNNYFKIYGGTFVGANPAWGDEGGMLPTSPNYLRPWSYYQGAFLDGQTFNENGIVLPEGYSITKDTHEDGRPIYIVTYEKP